MTALLKQVITENRTSSNVTFYSTREIARFFGTSQNTATLAVGRLESDGLLRRIRGSQTVMLGAKIITRSRIRAVVGLMSWVFAQRFSDIQKDLTRFLTGELWPHGIALQIIPHHDLGDTRPDLDAVLRKHELDFTIWPFPFNHHKTHLLHLQDRGIRNLVIGVDGSRSLFNPQILVDYRSSYEELLDYWKMEHNIKRVIVIKPREFTPRGRIEMFAKLAVARGFDSQIETSGYTLPADILARERQPVGIALLDEHSMAEFTFYDPPSFVKLLRRHRILFGNGALNVPFVPNGELRLERIFVPIHRNHSASRKPLAPAIANVLSQWCTGDFSADPDVIPTCFWKDGELMRYL